MTRTKRTARDRLREEAAASYASALQDIDVNAQQVAPEAAPPKGPAPTRGPAHVTLRKPADLDQLLQVKACPECPSTASNMTSLYVCAVNRQVTDTQPLVAMTDKLMCLVPQQNATLGLQTVEFDRDFGIRDEHILRLVKAVGGQLTTLRLGNSDTGDGTWLTGGPSG